MVAVIGEPGLRKWEGGAAFTLRVDKVELLGSKSANTASTGNNTAEATIGEPIDDLPF